MRACVLERGRPLRNVVPPRCVSLRTDRPPSGAPRFTAHMLAKMGTLRFFHGFCAGGEASTKHGGELGDAVPPCWFRSWGGLYVSTGRPYAVDFAHLNCPEEGTPMILQITLEPGDAYALDEDELGWANLALTPPVRAYHRGHTEEAPFWDEPLPLPSGGALRHLPVRERKVVEDPHARAWARFDWEAAWYDDWADMEELRKPLERVSIQMAKPVVTTLLATGAHLPHLRVWSKR